MRGFFGRGVYNGVETQPGGGEDVQEQEMIAQLLQQDERGMEALLLHYGPLMRYIIAPILPDPQDREECLSEVSMRVWSRIAQFDPARGSWNAWLTAVTRSTALNYQRSAARHGGTQTLPEGAPSPEASPEEALIQAERRAALHDALARFGQNDRALFYRKYYYLQSTAQIAAELGMTERAVEGRLYRLKKRLRTMLVTERHLNGGGVCQGGALFTLADLAFAAVANSHRRLTLSVTANITFLRPAKSGYVYADAAEVFNHHRIPFVEVKITNEKGELIAIFTSSGYRKETELPVEDLE